ncbi:MAG: hypothetical protein GF364_04255 [Candidatus Lokiarchaeota archaeon]|nr:hypothetical protein [Candidatus Lokiarchaeota archaeon]
MINDCENMMDKYLDGRSAEKRQNRRVKDRLESFSKEYGLASRQMALVAVVEREGDQAGKMPKTMAIPVGMPQDTSFDSYFVGNSSIVTIVDSIIPSRSFECKMCSSRIFDEFDSSLTMKRPKLTRSKSEYPTSDVGIRLAIMIEPDGGIPGDTMENRVLASIIVLLYFLQEEISNNTRAYVSHMKKLIKFVKDSASKCDWVKQKYINQIIEDFEKGNLSSCNLNSYISEIEKGLFKSTNDIWDEVINMHSN